MSSSSSFSSIYSNASTHTQGEMENEIDESEQFEAKSRDEESHQYMDAYSDEPIADEIWNQNYYRRQNEETERMNEWGLRLNGSKPVTSW